MFGLPRRALLGDGEVGRHPRRRVPTTALPQRPEIPAQVLVQKAREAFPAELHDVGRLVRDEPAGGGESPVLAADEEARGDEDVTPDGHGADFERARQQARDPSAVQADARQTQARLAQVLAQEFFQTLVGRVKGRIRYGLDVRR